MLKFNRESMLLFILSSSPTIRALFSVYVINRSLVCLYNHLNR